MMNPRTDRMTISDVEDSNGQLRCRRSGKKRVNVRPFVSLFPSRVMSKQQLGHASLARCRDVITGRSSGVTGSHDLIVDEIKRGAACTQRTRCCFARKSLRDDDYERLSLREAV